MSIKRKIMTELAVYLIRISLSMSLLYMVFWLFLRRETLFTVNRFYLLSALLLSLVLPLIRFRYPVTVPAGLGGDLEDSLQVVPLLQQGRGGMSAIWAGLSLIYLVGVVLFFFRIMWQFVVLLRLIAKNGISETNGVKVVYNRRFVLPFSFMNLVFMNPEKIREAEISDIIAHEKVHIRENHWLDLLVVEFMSIFLWFNPFIWFFERSIKQNHEYLADKGVVAQGSDVLRYHSVLINQLMGMEVIGITNNLNYSLNAKRLKMMNKEITPRAKAAVLVWALPVVLLLLAAFAQPDYRYLAEENEGNIGKEVNLTAMVLDTKDRPVSGADVFIKGKKVSTVTNSEGEFSLTADVADIVIIREKGFKDGVIYMEKLVAKNGDSGKYKLKVKLESAGEVDGVELSKEDQIKELEMVLKELTLKQEKLDEQKVKLAEVEKAGEVDQETLDKKKQALKKDYMMVVEKKAQVEKKLQYLKQ